MSSLKLKHSGGNSMSIEAPATNPASNLALKLPATIGSANQILKNSGTAGTLGWSTFVEDSSGRVLIGSTDGASYADSSLDDLIVGSTANGKNDGITILSGTAQNGSLAFADSGGTSRGLVGYVHNGDYLRLHAGNTLKARIDTDGLKFNSDTAAANALNDYEEGTWTPALYNSGGLTVHSANYLKIGKLCNVNGYVTISTNSNSSALRFNSLPFTAANVGYFIGSAYTQNTGGTHVFTQIDGNSTNLTVYKNDGSTIYQSDVSGGYVLFSGTYRTT